MKIMFYVGVNPERAALKVAVLKKEKKVLTVESLQTFPYGPDNVKLFYNLPPFHTGKETRICSGIGSSDTFIRKLHIPLQDRRKILETLPFQLESLVPFSSEAPLICPLFKSLSKQMTAVTVIATSEQSLTSHLKVLKEIDIVPDAVSCESSALMRFSKWQFPTVGRRICFDAKDQKMACVVCEGEEILLSQALFFSETTEIPIELEKLAIFLKQKGAIDDATPWVLTGETHCAEVIKTVFPGPMLELGNPDVAQFAVTIGLALDDLTGDEFSVQFCQSKFTPEHTFRSRQKKALSYAAFCLLAAAIMSVGGSLIQSKKHRLLVESLKDYLSPSLAAGAFSSAEEIEQKLYEWESSLKGQKNSFAFVPTVPKVSDVLAWVSSHSSFANEDGGQKEGIEIKSLHYSLTKYPTIGEPSAPYMAHFELEFNSQVPRAARDFHEALLKGDQIVNAKKEVKWQTQNQTYLTAFELNKGGAQ